LNENEINFHYPTLAVVNLTAYVFVCMELYRLVRAASDTALTVTGAPAPGQADAG